MQNPGSIYTRAEEDEEDKFPLFGLARARSKGPLNPVEQNRRSKNLKGPFCRAGTGI